MGKKSDKKKRAVSLPKWSICTEGETEALYLEAYCRDLGVHDLIDINSTIPYCKLDRGKACGRQHRSLIEQMQRCHNPRRYERSIAVHDFDEDGDVTRKLFDEASEIGEQADFSVYYSIPSFEFWLLLHLNLVTSDLSRDVCLDKVKKHVNDIRKRNKKTLLRNAEIKTDPDLYKYFDGKDGVERAKKHALELWDDKLPPKKPSSVRPSSNMYLLMDDIKEFAANRV